MKKKTRNERYQTPGQALDPGRIASLSDPRVGVLIPFFPCAHSGIEPTSRFCSSRSLGNKPIPIVLPIILYHGKQTWKAKPLHAYLSGDSSPFARFIPGFEYLLVDLSTIPDKQIMILFANNPAVKLWLLIQKYIFAEEELAKNLDSFFGPDIVYFSIEPDTILQKIPMLPDGAKEAIMTTAEKLRRQGKQEGRLEGKREGKLENARRMIEKGYPIEDICEITGLSREEVRGLR